MMIKISLIAKTSITHFVTDYDFSLCYIILLARLRVKAHVMRVVSQCFHVKYFYSKPWYVCVCMSRSEKRSG